jgi:hypothetical protein
MVAAHAYDVRAAKEVCVLLNLVTILIHSRRGFLPSPLPDFSYCIPRPRADSLPLNSGMRTVYVQRDTEDPGEDMRAVAADVDWFIDGTTGAGPRGGLVALADGLGA